MGAMDTLFTSVERSRSDSNLPLAVRMRPTSLTDFFGQQHAVGAGSWLRRAIERDALSSVILYGPAGTGKTTLARIIAHTTHAEFREVSAIGGTVKDLRQEIGDAQSRLYSTGQRTILFVDEIHRFSRSQQDALLHAVENRVVVLVGATTENPYFEVNSALLSRSRVVELKALSDEDIKGVLLRALASPRGLAGAYAISPEALDHIVRMSGGDARSALTTLELAAQLATPTSTTPQQAIAQAQRAAKASSAPNAEKNDGLTADAKEEEGSKPPFFSIGIDDVADATPHSGLAYDKFGDMHYDIISAFIKSMRGSDPDAVLYWMARMLDAGEDPKFIARRILICASEDVGNADPQALLVAAAAFKATEVIGMPECRINLAQAATYLALAPKSNAAEAGIDAALKEVRTGPLREVPSYLRDRHRPGSDSYGAYEYPHDYAEGWVDQRYLPEGLEKGAFYHPTPRGWEGWREETAFSNRT